LTSFGNLSKNTIFSDQNRQTQTNLVFWRQKINAWKHHPLGLDMILKFLREYQNKNDIVNFGVLAAVLLEYELRIHKHVSNYESTSHEAKS
jgi:hypothetical protein